MSQPSYKNFLKRSRSSIDATTYREDIIQGLALVCKAHADNDDVLLSSPLPKERIQIEEVSETTQVLRESRKLIDRPAFLPPLARSPSYPFDSNKELMRWFSVGQGGGGDSQEYNGSSRRRKCVVDHSIHAAALNKFSGARALRSLISASSDVGKTEGASHSNRAKEKMHVLDDTRDRRSLELSSDSHNHFQLPSTGAMNITFPQRQEMASLRIATLDVDNVQQDGHPHPHVSTAATGPVVVPPLEALPFPARRSCCVARDKCPQFGMLSVCGRRREMEDTYSVEPDFVILPCNSLGGCQCPDGALCGCSSFHFFGVYDGHGGTQASAFCKVRLHKALTEELIKDVRFQVKAGDATSSDWSLRWRKVMEACFLKIDKEVGGVCPAGGCSSIADGNSSCCVNPIAPDNVGTTAVIVVIGPCQIIVANCGDSRAVLSRGGIAVPLSQDHKPDRVDETSRIVAAGGRIIYWEGYRVGGLLAMSRAIGDRFLKNYVIAVPEVTCIERTKEDECLILASDGLWDVVSCEMACDLARRRLRSQRRRCANSDTPGAEETPAGAAAALLTKFALSRGSKDNISVIVIDLKSYFKKSL